MVSCTGKEGSAVDQKRIGRFLKELRKEKGLTQEQMAERLGVSGRTVSRWETGSNMPDISLLTEIAGLTAGGPGEAAALYCKSLVNVSVIMILLHSTGTLYRFRQGDRESSLPMPVRIALAAACAFAVAAVLRLALSALPG